MEIKEFDTVLLKDGRKADVVDFLGPKTYVVDVGSSPDDWETLVVADDDIEGILYQAEF